MEKILLSICVLTYNHREYIEKALESVFQQKFDFSFEVIIADDASTDGTQELLTRKYSDRAKLVLQKENLGALKNSRKMLDEANGKYILILEGDDFYYTDGVIARMVCALENEPKYVAVSAKRDIVDENGTIITHAQTLTIGDDVMTLQRFMKNEMFDWSATLLRKETIDHFDYDLACRVSRNVGDLSFCIMSLMQGDILLFDEVLGAYRNVRKVGKSNYNSNVTFWQYYTEHISILNQLRDNLDIGVSWKKKYSYYTIKAFYHINSWELKKKYYPKIISCVGLCYFGYALVCYIKKWLQEKIERIPSKIWNRVK